MDIHEASLDSFWLQDWFFELGDGVNSINILCCSHKWVFLSIIPCITWAEKMIPLCPLLFLLVAEDLSFLVVEAKCRGKFKGAVIANDLVITHLLFVDDIPNFFNGTCSDVAKLSEIINRFGVSTDMLVIDKKNILFHLKI